MVKIPRILLVILSSPDAKYGGEVMRRIVDRLPADKIRWASLRNCKTDELRSFSARSFGRGELHWRLRDTALSYWYANELHAYRIAREIRQWVIPFRPELIWTLADPGVATVAWHLHKKLNLPLHTTIHDAPVTARFFMPSTYASLYERRAMRLIRGSRSIDCICNEMSEYILERYDLERDGLCLTFLPSIPADWAEESIRSDPFSNDGTVRRIGLCGSMRVSKEQWHGFTSVLSKMHFRKLPR